MPIATTLPARNVILRFPPPTTAITRIDDYEAKVEIDESYMLLELPSEILKQVEGGKSGEPFPLTIKGRPSDDAVLCTPTSTFQLRTVNLSNSQLVCQTPRSPALDETLEIRDICHQVIECVPTAANLDRIRAILRDSQWQGLGSEVDAGDHSSKRRKTSHGGQEGGRKTGVKTWTRAQLESVIQASEVELAAGLKERHVIEYEGRLLLLPPLKLYPLLSLVLTLLTIHNTTTDYSKGSTASSQTKAPVQPILQALENDHDVPRAIAKGVLDLFGQVDAEDTWNCDVGGLVRETGRGLLTELGPTERRLDQFLERWRAEVGDTWEHLVHIKLLEGNYLLMDPPAAASLISPVPILTYFPVHTLPLHPPTRFQDLFLTRPRWRPEDMAPFLRGLTRDGDTKARDKLVAKFVRVVREKEGTWWYPRRTG